jgi:hypothetical protein
MNKTQKAFVQNLINIREETIDKDRYSLVGSANSTIVHNLYERLFW